MFKESFYSSKFTVAVIITLAILGFSGAGYLYYHINNDIIQNTSDLESQILELENQNIALVKTLKKEQQKNEIFANQIGQIAGTVGKLDKLSRTDKELLQKYSKVYFLNENYTPEDLVNIPPDYIYKK